MRMTLPPRSAKLMQSTQLVAIGIAQVCEVKPAGSAIALTRRILNRGPAILSPGLVPRVGFRRGFHVEPQGAPVSSGGRLPVYRLADEEHGSTVHIDRAAQRILLTRLATHGGEKGVVESLGPGHIVGTDHHVAEHEQSPPLVSSSASREEREINRGQRHPSGGLMRLIYSLLAVAQVRLARLDLARSDMLMRDADAAFARSRWRVALSDDLARRPGFDVGR